MAKKKIKARAGAKMHKAAGKGLAAYNRARAHAKMHAAAGEALGKHHAKKKGKKKRGKKKSKKRAAKKRTGYTTKVQVGRKKVRARVTNKKDSLVVAATANKDASGKKHVRIRLGVHKGRRVRLPHPS